MNEQTEKVGFLVDCRDWDVCEVLVTGETPRVWKIKLKARVFGYGWPGTNVRKFMSVGSEVPANVMFDTAQQALDFVAANLETKKREAVARFDRKFAALDSARAQWYLGDSPTGKKE